MNYSWPKDRPAKGLRFNQDVYEEAVAGSVGGTTVRLDAGCGSHLLPARDHYVCRDEGPFDDPGRTHRREVPHGRERYGACQCPLLAAVELLYIRPSVGCP